MPCTKIIGEDGIGIRPESRASIRTPPSTSVQARSSAPAPAISSATSREFSVILLRLMQFRGLLSRAVGASERNGREYAFEHPSDEPFRRLDALRARELVDGLVE